MAVPAGCGRPTQLRAHASSGSTRRQYLPPPRAAEPAPWERSARSRPAARSSRSQRRASPAMSWECRGRSQAGSERTCPWQSESRGSSGTWSTTMTTPMPALKPIRTGSEMKLATKPSRRIEASTSIAPTNSVNVAEAASSEAGSPFGTTSPKFGGGQDRERRGSAYAEYPRSAQHGVDHHRQEGRIQSNLHWQAGDRGIRHRFRNDHRSRGQASDDIGPQPFLAIGTRAVRTLISACGTPA